MEMVADILLVAGAFGAALYCHVLARRLSRFNDLESGMGGAVAVLSAQVDDLTRALQSAREAAGDSHRSLDSLTDRAESVAKRLELLVASMHDLPEMPEPSAAGTAAPTGAAQPKGTVDKGPAAGAGADAQPSAAPQPQPAVVFRRHRAAADEAVQSQPAAVFRRHRAAADEAVAEGAMR